MKFLRSMATLFCFASACTMVPANAQAPIYPNRAVQIIVPFGAGGLTDIVARAVAQRLQQGLGQSVVVLNKPGGGGGIVGTQEAARARPDGYTLYLGANSMATYRHVRPPNNPLTFSPETDFVPIGGVAASAHVFVVHKSSGVRTLAEFVALGKSKPGALTFASAGVGSTTHLPPALFAHEVGIDLLHVPYSGAAPALMDSMAGRVSLFAVGYSSAIESPIKDGTLIPLAVTSPKRLPYLPNVPTLVELGHPEMVFPIWTALFAPKGTPADVVQRLSSELEKISKDHDFQKQLYSAGNPVDYVPPDRLAKLLTDDSERLGRRIRAAKLNFTD